MLGHTLHRFLVPQSLVVFSVAIAMLMDPEPNMPTVVLRHIEAPLTFKSGILGIIVGGSLPFALGFIIASFAALFLRIAAAICKREKGFSTSWQQDAKNRLKQMYDFRQFQAEAEQAEQCLISELALKRPLEWMQRRWEYSILSFNAAIALFLSVLIVPILRIAPGLSWFTGSPHPFLPRFDPGSNACLR